MSRRKSILIATLVALAYAAGSATGYYYASNTPESIEAPFRITALDVPLAADLRTEDDFVRHVNKVLQGKLEHRFEDGTRCDILTDTLAIEVDFAKKWYEAVGQSAHYSRLSGKQAAILLIAREPKDEKYIEAAILSAEHIKIDGKQLVVLVFRNY